MGNLEDNSKISGNFENFKIKDFWSIFFSELKIFLVNSFDAEKAYLSIGGIFRAIWAFPEALEQI